MFNEKDKLTEEELIEFWNSYFFDTNKKNVEDVSVSSVIHEIKCSLVERNPSNAYMLSKKLSKMIADKMIETKETMKVVINDGWGGFGLSQEAIDLLAKIKGKNASEINVYYMDRNDEDLVKVVELLGDKANMICSDLKVVEIPKGIEYKISEYDGWEKVVY